MFRRTLPKLRNLPGLLESNYFTFPKMTKTLPFGDQQVPVPGFGAMGLNHGMGTDLDASQSEAVLLKAIELGCTFWDTAVSLGCEELPGCV